MTRPALEPLAPFFRSDTQARLLVRFDERAGEWIPMNALEDAGGSHQAVRLELRRLLDAGVIERDETVRPHRYRMPIDGPLTAPLRELVQRTIGVEQALRSRLAAIRGVRAAAIHGSWAARAATPRSDIDVIALVDRDVDLDAVRASEREVQRTSGREIDTMLFTSEEAAAKLESGSGFLRTVLAGPLVPLVGDIRDQLDAEGGHG